MCLHIERKRRRCPESNTAIARASRGRPSRLQHALLGGLCSQTRQQKAAASSSGQVFISGPPCLMVVTRDKAGRIPFFCTPGADVSSHLKIAPGTTAAAGEVIPPSPAWGVRRLLLQENQSLWVGGPLAAPYDSSH